MFLSSPIPRVNIPNSWLARYIQRSSDVHCPRSSLVAAVPHIYANKLGKQMQMLHRVKINHPTIVTIEKIITKI